MLQTIIQGSWMMVPLMICSVLALAAIIDRWWAFRTNAGVDARALRSKVLDLLGEGEIDEAAKLCASTPGPVSAVILAGLQAYSRLKAIGGKPEIIRTVTEKAMEDYSLHAMSAVEKRLNILSTVGNAAPLLGMTGTVTGMIRSFAIMSSMEGLQAGAVAGGIAEALVTTAAGLLIAIAAVIPYHIFMSMANKVELEIEETSTELLDYVTIHEGVKG
ncbi:MAG: MotA/TolQ/ExbB proton channel family protein [Planctomycetota bacterium]|jgi:biopolymer transport protein ExbB